MDNIYQRPLFRQMGGPTTAPSPMPAAEAVPTDVTAQLRSMEQAASNQMEAVGAQYVDNMVSGLDNAENTEEVINAIRGNDKPIQARYEELAGIVGDQDAQSTPESVLALVQPTMMMTEQGALDTGIGELVQSLTGDIAMETETGAPTAMGQGIGELMMGAAEPVQQYANGGVVQHFQSGGVGNVIPNLSQTGVGNVIPGVPSQLISTPLNRAMMGFNPMTDFSTSQLQKSFETRLPLYEELLGDTENRRKQAKAKLSFDIAKAGLALASGVDPMTGQSMTAQPLGAQIARAAQPVAASAQQAGETIAEAGRGAKIAALQAAEADEIARREQAGAERSSVLNFGVQTDIQNREQIFRGVQRNLDRELQRESQESLQDHQARLQDQTVELERELTVLKESEAMNRLKTDNNARLILQTVADDALMARLERSGEQALEQDELRGEISRALQQLTDENRYKLQQLIGGQNFKELEAEIEARAKLFDAETQRRINEIQLQFENDEALLDSRQSHELETIGEQLKFEFERLDRTAGTGGFFGTPTTAQLAARQQDFLERSEDAAQSLRTRQNYINNQFKLIDAQQRQSILEAQQQGALDEAFLQRLRIESAERVAALNAMQNSNLSFGNSQSGFINDLISNPTIVQQYGNGTLDPMTTSFLETGLSILGTPTTTLNERGEFVTQTPTLPRGITQAIENRRISGLPAPFATGGEVQKMQAGGPVPDYSRVDRAFGLGEQQRPLREEDVVLPGRIIDPTVDLSQGAGVLRPLKEPFRAATSYAKEVGLYGRDPVFGEAAEAATQLTSLGNITQRFIRESVGGRALKDEIQALADELAKPEGIQTRERAYEKLVNMRNQLLELEDFAQSIIDTPEKFARSDLTQARKDIRLLQPLLENYDFAIGSFEKALGSNKPDPSMFEGQ